jgi:hypothetical protein
LSLRRLADARERLRAPHGDTCNGKPCWKGKGTPIGGKSWIYTDKGLTPTGLSKVVLKPGLAEKGKLQVKGKGAAVILPPMPILSFPLRAQLQGAGNCWEATYGATTVVTNTTEQLKLKGPAPDHALNSMPLVRDARKLTGIHPRTAHPQSIETFSPFSEDTGAEAR